MFGPEIMPNNWLFLGNFRIKVSRITVVWNFTWDGRKKNGLLP